MSSVDEPQCLSLVQCNVIGLITLDLVLRIVLTCVMDVAFVVHIARMHSHDVATDPTSLGIPGHVIANFECLSHELMLVHPMRRMPVIGSKWL